MQRQRSDGTTRFVEQLTTIMPTKKGNAGLLIKWVLLSIGVVFGIVCEIVALPLFLYHTTKYIFFGLWWSSLTFFGFCLLAFVVLKCCTNTVPSPIQQNWKLFSIIGGLQALGDLLANYSIPRIPVVLVDLLLVTPVFFSIPVTKSLVKSEQKVNYCSFLPISALSFIIIGIFLTVIPYWAYDYAKNSFIPPLSEIAWLFIGLFAFLIPSVFNNVLQERYMKDRRTEPYTDRINDILSMLIVAGAVKLISTVTFFAVDFMPWFGASSNIREFGLNQKFALECVFGTNDQCQSYSWAYAMLYNFGISMKYACQTGLNEDSATYCFMVSSMVTPFTIAFWKLEKFPIWSIVSSILCVVSGTALWKLWELKEHQRSYSYESYNET